MSKLKRKDYEKALMPAKERYCVLAPIPDFGR